MKTFSPDGNKGFQMATRIPTTGTLRCLRLKGNLTLVQVARFWPGHQLSIERVRRIELFDLRRGVKPRIARLYRRAVKVARLYRKVFRRRKDVSQKRVL